MGYKNLRPGEIAEKSNTNNYTLVQDGPKLERKKKILSLIYFANALAHEDDSAEEKCRRLAGELFDPLNQRDAAQAEADQLRAQVAALEAEVARLKEPAGLVWKKAENRNWWMSGEYFVAQMAEGFSASFDLCRPSPRIGVFADLDAAKAACSAHHAARYREMQGTTETKETPK